MNKQNLWFLTLFSLVLILSIYYVTMPNDILEVATSNNNSQDLSVSIDETDVISTLKVEDARETDVKLEELEKQLNDESIETSKKNEVYEEIKEVNSNKALSEKIEGSINKEYSCKAFSKIDNTTVKVIVNGCDNSKSLANNIMRLVQKEFDKKMYISVEFKS